MRKRPAGFSLIEMMMVIGLIGVVMMGSMRLFQDAFKTQTRVEAGQDSILITDQLARILSDAPTCSVLMKGTASKDDTPIILGKGLYKGATLGKIRVTDLRLREVSELTDDVFLAKVLLQGERTNGEGGQFSRELPVVYRTDKAGFIKECLGDNFGTSGNCKSLGGTWDTKKRECDFCSALGGESNARGRCQLAGTPIASCPMQKAFGSNSTSMSCGGRWDSDFIGDAVRYLGSFRHMSSESINWFKTDLQKVLDNPPLEELSTKTLGGRKEASWLIIMEPPIEEVNKPCSIILQFTVKCP